MESALSWEYCWLQLSCIWYLESFKEWLIGLICIIAANMVDCNYCTYHTWRASKSDSLVLDAIQRNGQHHCNQCSSLNLANYEPNGVKIWKLYYHESMFDCHSHTYHTWRASKSHLLVLDAIQRNGKYHCSPLTSLNLAKYEPKEVIIWKLHGHESMVDCNSDTYHTWRASKSDWLVLDAIQRNFQHHCSQCSSLNLANYEPNGVKIWKLHYHESIVDCNSHTYHTWRASKSDSLVLEAIQRNCQHHSCK